jgi:enamine deaminase RidA (YjgF/YER057c/UK114 family)
MAERRSVNFPGFSHQNPIPNASRVGNIVMSSVIGGSNPGTRDLPPTVEAQVANVFGYIRAAVAAAGGGPEHIVKLDFFVKDPATQREALNAGAPHPAAAARQPRAGAGFLRRRPAVSGGSGPAMPFRLIASRAPRCLGVPRK